MHEAAITQSIVDSVIETLNEQHVTGNVTEIVVTVGVSQGLIPESMQMYFDMSVPDTPLKDAQLNVVVQPMIAHCPQCDEDHELMEPIMYCPVCGTPMDLVKGDEILITSIEVENDED